MKLGKNGTDLMHSFEGCRLYAYKPVKAEPYYTIGWGHCGPDVAANAKITQKQADALFKKDVARFEKAVNALKLKGLNQNQFDALVSFTYNCGEGSLKTLVKNRTLSEIANAIPLYNKDVQGRVVAGLVRRRAAERTLFLKPISTSATSNDLPYDARVASNGLNVRKQPNTKSEIIRVAPKGSVMKVWGIQTVGTEKWGKSVEGFFNLAYTERV